jgi:hypothetical protein
MNWSAMRLRKILDAALQGRVSRNQRGLVSFVRTAPNSSSLLDCNMRVTTKGKLLRNGNGR